MNSEELLGTIVKTAYTRTDLYRRIHYLRQYLEHGYFWTGGRKTIQDWTAGNIASKHDAGAMVAWGDEFFAQFTKETMYNQLTEISRGIKKLPQVTLYIPYDPTPEETTRMGRWFRESVSPMLLIDLHIDPLILGGCSFVWKGYYRDYSLRYYVHKKREEIIRLIIGYDKPKEEKTVGSFAQ